MVGLARHRAAVSIGGVTLWLVTIGLSMAGGEAGHIPVRTLATALAVALGIMIFRGPSRLMILSPLYLLGLIGLVFFSLAPALYAAFYEQFSRVTAASVETVDYVGSLGEMLVLQFATFAFVITALVSSVTPATPEPDVGRSWSRIGLAGAIFALGLAIVLLVISNPSANGGLMAGGVGREIVHALPVWISFGLSVAAVAAARRSGWWRGAFVVVIAAILVMMLKSILAEIPLFICLSGIGLVVVLGRVRPAQLIATFVACAILLGATLFLTFERYTIAVERAPPTLADLPLVLARSGISKFMIRSGVSGECLDRIARRSIAGPGMGNPLYFAGAVVPRVLWPGKPSLSRGTRYTVEQCGGRINPAVPHSESITLLGEPILNAGAWGLALAQLVIGAALAAVTVIAHRHGAIGIVALTAILPWLIHFDQHFALYLANAVKMFILTIPLIVGLVLWHRRATQ